MHKEDQKQELCTEEIDGISAQAETTAWLGATEGVGKQGDSCLLAAACKAQAAGRGKCCLKARKKEGTVF